MHFKILTTINDREMPKAYHEYFIIISVFKVGTDLRRIESIFCTHIKLSDITMSTVIWLQIYDKRKVKVQVFTCDSRVFTFCHHMFLNMFYCGNMFFQLMWSCDHIVYMWSHGVTLMHMWRVLWNMFPYVETWQHVFKMHRTFGVTCDYDNFLETG
jgi:hypothetical protein